MVGSSVIACWKRLDRFGVMLCVVIEPPEPIGVEGVFRVVRGK